MQQLKKDTLCYYCLGCNAEENMEFKPVMRCKNFVKGHADWQNRLREELKKNEI